MVTGRTRKTTGMIIGLDYCYRMAAGIYVRISRDPKEVGAGISRQEEDCRTMLARAGYADPVLYVDNNRSAWKRDRKRPGWDALLRDIEAGMIDMLAIYHPDRLMRQPQDLETLIQIADRGLSFMCAGGGRDLGSADDRFVLRIETAAACKSSDDTSRRLRRAFDDKAMSGSTHGGPRPFGLADNRNDLHPDESAAIRECARLLLAGESLRGVTAWLNSSGMVPTGKRKPKRDLDGQAVATPAWSPTTVRQMLLRPSIAGRRFPEASR